MAKQLIMQQMVNMFTCLIQCNSQYFIMKIRCSHNRRKRINWMDNGYACQMAYLENETIVFWSANSENEQKHTKKLKINTGEFLSIWNEFAADFLCGKIM